MSVTKDAYIDELIRTQKRQDTKLGTYSTLLGVAGTIAESVDDPGERPEAERASRIHRVAQPRQERPKVGISICRSLRRRRDVQDESAGYILEGVGMGAYRHTVSTRFAPTTAGHVRCLQLKTLAAGDASCSDFSA